MMRTRTYLYSHVTEIDYKLIYVRKENAISNKQNAWNSEKCCVNINKSNDFANSFPFTFNSNSTSYVNLIDNMFELLQSIKSFMRNVT